VAEEEWNGESQVLEMTIAGSTPADPVMTFREGEGKWNRSNCKEAEGNIMNS